MVKIYSRKTWGATQGDGNGGRALPASTAWLHHSVTYQLGRAATFAQEAAQMRAIERIGVQRFGAHYGFPYTYGVFPSGRAYEGHDIGQRGAHTAGHNTDGIGICWPGNYETHRPTAEQVETTAQLLVDLKRAGKLRTARLNGGHRDSTKAVQLYGPTACPGKFAHALVDDINRRAAELERGATAPPSTPPPSSGSTPTDAQGRYRVRPGDTLGELAARFRTSVDALVLLNGISDPDRIDVDDRLYTRWVVGRGDTLGEIAERAGTSVARLVQLNGIRNPDHIQVGQLIRLP